MPLTDVSQVATGLNLLQLREAATSSSSASHHLPAVGRQVKQLTMNSPTCVLGRQGNQNAAALPPEEGIGSTREFMNCSIVQENGQRRYGPPRGWKSDPPPRGCEVFIGKIPRDCFEDELIPVFEQIGPIYMFRLMMEFNGSNRGYGFCVYTNREDTKRAVQELDNYEIRKGKTIGVCFSVDNCRLFVGGIPKSKTREEIMTEMKRVTDGVKDVISYPSVNDKSKNRGFAFVEYESHKAAAMARRKLIPGRIQLWNQQIAVDWAEPEREVNEDIMSKVKILYVRNLMLSTTEESLREHFVRAAGGDPTCIERVKKITDYAFIHFKEREQAEICLNVLNDTAIDGSKIEVTWAKPVDKSEANLRQQSSHTSNKLLSELALGKELRSNNPLLIDPRTNSALSGAAGLLTHLDPSIPFVISPVGQHTPITPDILPINPALPTVSGTNINIANTGGSRLNGARNGRRNAAGSRSAGIQRDRKHPVEKLQQRQMNPFSFFELLEELSRNVGWGTPNFTVLPTDFVDTLTGNKFQLYIGQVYLPNLRLQYQSPRYYATPEEAKIGACEMAILHLQYHQVLSADVFAANYALALGTNMLPSGTAYLPLQLPSNGPAPNNTVGILQPSVNCLPMSGNGNQTGAHPTMGLGHSADCAAALTAMNGFDYSPAFLPGPMAATLITPLGNASAYLLDPNSASTAQAAPMLVPPGSSISGLTTATATCPAELIHNHSLGQTASFPAASVPQTGLYSLGLQQPTLQHSSSQLTISPNNHGSLLSLISQQQAIQQSASNQMTATSNVSLQTAQSIPTPNMQTCLPVPAPV